jgi:hypothetical protein
MLLSSPKDFENCGCKYELLSFECKSLSPKWSTGFPVLQICFLKAAKTPASRFEKKVQCNSDKISLTVFKP